MAAFQQKIEVIVAFKGLLAREVVYGTAGLLLLVMFVFLYPNYTPHPPPYNMYMKNALRSFYTGCVIFWEENDNDIFCDQETAFKQLYGEDPLPLKGREEIAINGGGTSATFSATASHKMSSKKFRINAQGEVEESPGLKPD